MEKELKIKTSDGKYIYGRLRGALEKPLVIFVHGLTGHMDEHIFYNGARLFEKKGFAVLQWNQYDWRPGARKLEEVTLEAQAADLDFLVAHFRKKGARKIFVVGHSYGGATIVLSQAQAFDAVVLWDATNEPKSLFDEIEFLAKAKLYVISWGAKNILGKAMVEEAKQMPDLYGPMAQFRKPVKIIVAGKGGLIPGGRKFFQAASVAKEFAIIKGATHTFDEGDTEQELFAETLKWLKKFTK
jgi:pimeloyl-ACP methyl ester carboxylesterase